MTLPRQGPVRHPRALAGALLLAGLGAACGPPPEPVVAPAPTAVAVAPTAPAPTAAVAAGPREPLPPLHPCVPDFIQKELHACEPGAFPADYSAVVRAMDSMVAAGPTGPQPKSKAPVPRELAALEQKAASVARAFLCKQPEGEPDDEHAAIGFEVGRLYFAANHFEEASVFLRDVAVLDPQKHADVEYAARFFLESMKVLAQARPECAGGFAALATAVDTHVCKGAGAAERAESCAAIAKLQEGAAPPN